MSSVYFVLSAVFPTMSGTNSDSDNDTADYILSMEANAEWERLEKAYVDNLKKHRRDILRMKRQAKNLHKGTKGDLETELEKSEPSDSRLYLLRNRLKRYDMQLKFLKKKIDSIDLEIQVLEDSGLEEAVVDDLLPFLQ